MYRSFEESRPARGFPPPRARRGVAVRPAVRSVVGAWLVALCAGAVADGADLPTPAAAGLDAWPAPGEPWPASLDAHTRIVAVPPETRIERKSVEHRAPSTRLVRGTLDGGVPPSPTELEAVAASGVDIGALPAGTCVNEWYEAPLVRTGERRVLTREASETLAVEPAAFEDIALPVEVRPAHARLVEIPATWRDEERKVMVEPASTAWVRGEGPIQRFDAATGEIMCRIDVPAKHRVLAGASVEVPAMVTTVRQDAVVETVDVARLAADARELRTPVPAETVRLTRRTTLNEAGVEWRPVLCRTNVTPDVVRRIQLALDDAGHSPNGIDGLFGPGTRRALEDYQSERGPPTGGLTLETVESLGVALHAGTVADAAR